MGEPVWVYLFTWKSRGFGGLMGAMHVLEISFVWNQDLTVWAALIGDGHPEPAELADQMHRTWIAFTRTGGPNHGGLPHWLRYDTARRPAMGFGDTSSVRDDPDGVIRSAWD